MKDLKQGIFKILLRVYKITLSKRLRLFEKFRRLRFTILFASHIPNIGYNPIIMGQSIIKGGKNIQIGDRFYSLGDLRIEVFSTENSQGKLIIGNNVVLNKNTHIGASKRVEIHDNVLIGSNVLITDHNHSRGINGLWQNGPLISKGKVVIENNVWIGENSCILTGVRIGENSIVAAGSVVTKSFPKNSIIGGVPAKILNHV